MATHYFHEGFKTIQYCQEIVHEPAYLQPVYYCNHTVVHQPSFCSKKRKQVDPAFIYQPVVLLVDIRAKGYHTSPVWYLDFLRRYFHL